MERKITELSDLSGDTFYYYFPFFCLNLPGNGAKIWLHSHPTIKTQQNYILFIYFGERFILASVRVQL